MLIMMCIHNQVWQAYKNAEAKFWSAEEVELSDDAEGTLSPYSTHPSTFTNPLSNPQDGNTSPANPAPL